MYVGLVTGAVLDCIIKYRLLPLMQYLCVGCSIYNMHVVG